MAGTDLPNQLDFITGLVPSPFKRRHRRSKRLLRIELKLIIALEDAVLELHNEAVELGLTTLEANALKLHNQLVARETDLNIEMLYLDKKMILR